MSQKVHLTQTLFIHLQIRTDILEEEEGPRPILPYAGTASWLVT